MKKPRKPLGESADAYILGEETFAAITAVEGVSLSDASRKRFAAMKKLKLTNDEQRFEVIRAYAEAKER